MKNFTEKLIGARATFRTFILAALLLVLAINTSRATVKTATVNSTIAWGSIVWSPTGTPVSGDDITITCNTSASITGLGSVLPTAGGNFINFATTGTGVLTLSGSSTTIGTTKLVCGGSVTLASCSFSNVSPNMTGASSVAASKTLTIASLCLISMGTGGVFTVSGTVAINNATGILNTTNSAVLIASGGAINYTATTATPMSPLNCTVQSGGTLNVTATTATGSTVTIPSLSVQSGGTLIVNAGASGGLTVTFSSGLTIAGTLSIRTASNGTITISGSGTAPTYSGTPTLDYETNVATFTASSIEWPSSSGPSNVTINLPTTTNIVTMPGSRTISGVLTMTGGILSIGASSTLTLSGTSSGGSATAKIRGSSSSNLTISGSAGSDLGSAMYFDQTTDGTTNNIATLTLSRTGTTPTFTLFSNSANVLHVSSSLALSSSTSGSALIVGSAKLDIKGSPSRSAGQLTLSSTSILWIGVSSGMPSNFFGTYISNAGGSAIGTVLLYNNTACTGNTTGYSVATFNLSNGATFENAGSTSTGAWTFTGTATDDGYFELSNSTLNSTTTVANAATFNIGSNGSMLFSSSASANQFTVGGGTSGIVNDSGASYQYNGASYQPVIFNAASTYNYISSGGTHGCIFASWNATSTFNMTGPISSMIQLAGGTAGGDLTDQTFGNFNWNSSTQGSSVTLVGNLTCAGNFTMTACNSKIVGLGGYKLTVGGNFSNSLSAGSFDATATHSTILMNGTTQTFNIGAAARYANSSSVSIIDSLVCSSSTSTTLSTNGVVVNGFNLTGGTFSISSLSLAVGAGHQASGGTGTYTNNGTLNASNGTLTLQMNNSTNPNFNIGTYTSSLVSILNIASGSTGASLGSAINASTLTMTSGLVTTTSSNIITVKGTLNTNVTGGSATCYVKGPLARTFSTSITAASYLFPVGKSQWDEFDLVPTATTTAPGGPVIQVEVFDAATSGAPGAGFDTTGSYSRYWNASFLSGSITGTGTYGIRLLDATRTITSGSAVGYSSTLGGTVSGLGGSNFNSPSAGYVTSSLTVPNALGYFEIGARVCLSGTYSIGPSGASYTSIANAVAVLDVAEVCGNLIYEMQSGYDGTTVETFPITISTLYNPNSYTVTFRPASGASGLVTSGDPGSGNPLFDLSGVTNVSLDGRSGGSGTTINWIVRNTRTAATVGPAIQMQSGCTADTLQYLQIESQNSSAAGGTVFVTANATPVATNSADVIQDCYITSYVNGSTYQLNGICFYGNASAQFNNNMKVLNNNIANFTPNGSSVGSGICVTGTGSNSSGYGNNFTISGNSLYNTLTQSSSYYLYPIYFAPYPASTSNIISNNYIGGQSALCGGTGSPWLTSSASSGGAGTPAFAGIYVYAGSTGTTSITGNTISNIQINNSNNNGNIFGIDIQSNSGTGTFNVTGNTIGNPSPSGSAVGIQYLGAGGNGGAIAGIINQTLGTINIGATGSGNGNTIANFSHTGGSANCQVIGIASTSGVNSLVNNTIFNLAGAAAITSGGGIFAEGSVAGIASTSTITGQQSINNNTIYNLTNTVTSATNIYGIRSGIPPLALPSSHSFDSNLIYGLACPNTNTAQVLIGIGLEGSSSSSAVNFPITNNMVDLGYRTDGSVITCSASIIGIYDHTSGYSGTPDATYDNYIKVWHNSVYVGGTGVTGGAVNTYCFNRNNTNSSPKNVESIYNNIFENNRSYNVSGTGYNVGIGLDNNLTYSPNLITTDYNIVFGAGTQYQFGYIASGPTAYANKAAWIAANATFDVHSIENDPKFTTPAAGTPNLDIQASPVFFPGEATGTSSFTVTSDFHGKTRASYTPVDIGADAGNFGTAPSITYIAIGGSSSTTSGTLSPVSITSSTSTINITTGTKPRLYFKKSTDANSINDNTSGTAGWKYVESNGTTSPFDFTITYSLLNGSAVAVGTIIQYFVVAQDNNTTPVVGINAGSFPGGSNYPASVSLATGNLPTGTINSYTILNSIGATYYVGTGGCATNNYATLTGTSGFFATMNTGSFVMDKNVTVYITSSITESGANALNLIPQGNGGPFTMTITPCSATAFTLSGSFANASTGLITLNGASDVIIDGQYAGDGLKHLTFQNTASDAAATGNYSTIFFENDAVYDTVRNSVIQGHPHNNASGVVFFGTSSGSLGNSYNSVTSDSIGPIGIGTASGDKATNLICSSGSTTALNHDNAISNNNLADFSILTGASSTSGTLGTAINITGTGNGSNWKINGNSIYYVTAATNARAIAPLNFIPGAASINDTISGNYIGGTAPLCANTWTSSYNASYALATLAVGTDDNNPCIFSGNTISGFSTTNASGASTDTVSLLNITSGSVDVKSSNTFGNIAGNFTFTSVPTVTPAASLIGVRSSSSNTVIIDSSGVGGLLMNTTGVTTGGGMLGIYSNGTGKIIITNSAVGIIFTQATSSSVSTTGILITTTSTGNRVENNQIVDMGNISTSSNTSNVYGIYISGLGTGATVKSNSVSALGHEAATGTVVGIYLNDASQNTGTYQVWNNMVYMNNDDGLGAPFTTTNNIYGIQDNGIAGSASNYYFNSVMIDSLQTSTGNIASAAFYRFPNKSGSVTGGTDTLYNNIFINRRSGGTTSGTEHYAIVNKTSSSPATGWVSDYNFIGSTNTGTGAGGNCIGLWNSTLITAWSGAGSWQTTSAFDSHSQNAQVWPVATHTASDATHLNANLLFANDSNFNFNYSLQVLLTSSASTAFISNLGHSISGVTTDFYGNVRCPGGGCSGGSSAPDIGFNEFGSSNDAGVSAITVPCPGSQTVYATIYNYGAITLNSVTVNWYVNGVAQTPASFSSLGLATNASVVKAIGTYNFTSGTYYTIDDSTSSPNGVADGNTLNDDYTYTGYIGFPSTVYVGTGSGTPSFATYSALFAAINGSTVAGNVNVIVQNSTTEPVVPTFLNAQNFCSGGADTIFISPASATLFTASVSTNYSAVIGFNGASNIVIDGSYSGSGRYLEFLNTNSSSSTGTVIFQNSANHIQLKNCIIDLQSSAASTGPVISLSTSTNGSTGNSYITISGDSIGDAGSYLSTNMIQSSGTSGTPNHDNTISNNSIFNFSDATRAYGINITSTGNGSNWTLNGNSIYNTNAVATGAQTAIAFLPGSSSTGDTIMNGYIGGSAPYCGNSGHGYWENSWTPSGTTNNVLYVDSINAGAVSVMGNTIEKRIYNSDGKNSGIVVFAVSGSSNVTIANNTIGNPDATQADEIVCNGGATAGSFVGYLLGVTSTSSGTLTINNNAFYYLGQLGALSGGYVTGVVCKGAIGNINVTQNIFKGLQSTQGYDNLAVDIEPSAGITIHIDSNTVSGPVVQTNGVVAGLYAVGVSGVTGTINKNTIYGLYNASNALGSSYFTEGIELDGAGTWTISNNYISLENYASGTVYTNAIGINGITDGMTGGSLTCAYNSVYIGGSETGASGSAYNSYAFTRLQSGETLVLKDNIFMNSRSGVASHYAIATTSTTGWAGASDYNFLSSSNSSILGNYGGTNESTTNWQSASSGDSHSRIAQTTSGSTSSTLINPGDLFTAVSTANLQVLLTVPAAYAYVSADGNPVSGVTSDIYDTARSSSHPDMGADEFVGCSVSASISGQTNVTCNGGSDGSATVGATGPGTLSYSWSPGGSTTNPATGLSAQSYTVTVSSSSGCSTTASVTITQPGVLSMGSCSETDATCNGTSTGSVTAGTVSNSVGTVNYSWMNSGNTVVGTTATVNNLPADVYTVTVTDNCSSVTCSKTINQPGVLSINTCSETDATCNGTSTGSVTATVSNSVGTINYTWKNSSNVTVGTTSNVNNLPADTYTVTVTDNCSSVTCSKTISQPGVLSIGSCSETDASCYGKSTGSVTAGTVSNSVGTVNYSWKNSSNATVGTTATVNNLPADSYTVTATDNCSSVTCSTTIGQPTAIIANASSTPASCNGYSDGSVASTASGGSGSGYTYLWSPGGSTNTSISSLGYTSTTYTVTVTDGTGCTGTGTTSVTQPPVVAAPVITAPVCEGSTSSVSGTSTEADGTTITVYDGLASLGTTTVTSGAWSLTGLNLAPSDAITAKATSATGCLSSLSSSVSVDVCNYTVNLFLQGYYVGGGHMSPLLHLLGAASTTAVDTVTIQLRSAGSPGTVAYSFTGTLQTNGSMVCYFDGGASGNAYYIVIKHRNSIETWSATPQTITSGGGYDFTASGAAYYNSGSSSTVNLGSGVYGIYGGDINQDGSIDATDNSSMQSVLSTSFQVGVYNANDITGDGFVDEDDLRILQNNIPLIITSQHP